MWHAKTGGRVVYNKLLEHNVKNVFLYSGGAIMNLIDQFHKGHINYFINTHEQSCGHAATGYAKSSNETGVCVVTSGPGLTNMVTPMLDATNDSTPLVVFSGQVSRSAMGTQAFQECPATEITKSVTKWNHCVENLQELPAVIDEAFKVANHGKKGAVHIDIPKCILNEKQDYYIKQKFIPRWKKFKTENNKNRNAPSYNNLIKLIKMAKKPVLYIGKGCNHASIQLRLFALKYNIPVTTTIHALGVFDENDPLALEMVGMHGSVAANYAIQQSDLIIALGSRFDDRTIGALEHYAPEAFKAAKEKRGGIVHVNIESNEINKIVQVQYGYCMDCKLFLQEILQSDEEGSSIPLREEWIAQTSEWKRRFPFMWDAAPDSHIKPQDVISEINTQLTDIKRNKLITTGVGNHQMFAAQFIKWDRPQTMITSGSLGVMGVGLPYAIGCQIANPRDLVIDIDGDGSFHHTLAELKTINDHNLPIKIAIMNDGHMSMVRAWEKLFFNERYTATGLSNNPNYVALAESFGIKGLECSKINELEHKIKYFLNYPGPILCDFKTETDMCLPLVGPGRALDDMILHKENILLGGSAPN